MFAVSIVVFSAVAFLPGDFTQAVLGQSATPETVAAFRTKLGLDLPPVERYLAWISGALRGDFGVTFSSWMGEQQTVASFIGPRLRNTIFLAATTAAIAVPLSIVLGAFAAVWRGGFFDRCINAVTLTTISFPEFLVAYVLIYLFAVQIPLFHSLSTVNEQMTWIESWKRIVLPVLTLCFVIVAHMMRMTRTAIINVLKQPYIEMAHLKGVRPMAIVWRHALPNAIAPIATVVAFNIAYLIVGVVIVEVVFVYPGIGQAMVDAVRSRDIAVVQACALIFSLAYITLNLAADVITVVNDPRLLYPR